MSFGGGECESAETWNGCADTIQRLWKAKVDHWAIATIE